jgi:hypothetical protein
MTLHSLPNTGTSNPDGIHVDFTNNFAMKKGVAHVCLNPFRGTYGGKAIASVWQFFNLFKKTSLGCETQDRGIVYFGTRQPLERVPLAHRLSPDPPMILAG